MKKNYLFLFILMALSATWLGADNHKLLPMNYRINEANDPQASAYPSVACQGETVFLFASGGSAYSWTGPNGFTSNISNPVISNIQLSGNGTYTVDITTDDGIVTKSVNVRVNLTQMPELPDIVGCAGSSVDGFAIPGGDNYNWIQWTNSNTDVGLAGIGQNNIPDFTMQNNTNAPINSTVSYTIAPITIPTLPLVYDYADRHHEYSNFKLNAGTNYLEVTPGQSINLTGNVNVSKVGNYCTGCIVQYYIGIGSTNTTLFCHLYSNGNLPFSDNINVNFTAPTTPGYYYISTENSLEFSCITKDFNQNPDRAIALIKVEEPAIAPNSSLSFDSGDKHIDITNIKLNNGSNVAKVSPGQSIDLSYQYNVTDLNNHFCQNYCLVQFYTGIGTTSSTIQCFDVDNIMINGTLNNTFTAPTTPGLYYIVEKSSLNYECVPQSFDNSPEMSIAMIIVQPEEFCKADTGRFKIIVNPLPTSTAASNSPICVGTTLNLTSSGGTSYNWSGPGGFTSTLQNPTRTNATAAMAGTYTVTVTNANGCSSNATTTVVVNDLPIATAGSNSPVCAGATINLTSSGGTNYSWSGPGGFTSTLQNPTRTNATAAMAGTYTVTVTNANGCSSTATTSVVVNDLPIATAGSNSPVCAGATINLTSSGGTIYNWSGPGGFTSTLQNPTRANATAAMAGTYTVTVTNANGCSSTATTSVVVNALPIATAGSNSPVCTGSTINLTASGGTNYSWSGPGGFTSTLQSPTRTNATAAMAGTYTVTVTNANGCSSTATTTVVVNALPIATAGSNSPVCTGSTINLTASGGTSYSWSGPGGFTSTLQNPTRTNATGAMAGTYTVTVTSSAGCSSTATTDVVVNPLPNAIAKADPNPVCSGHFAQLFAKGGVAYAWSGPGGFSSSQQNPGLGLVETNQAGTYTVTVTNNFGCSSTASVNLVVNQSPNGTASVSPQFVCVGGQAQLSASGGSTYLWRGPGGFTSTQQNPLINVTSHVQGGTYWVTISNANGCYVQLSVELSVSYPPAATATHDQSTACTGSTLKLFGSGVGTYLWTGPAGFSSTLQNPVIPNVTPANSGTYTLVVTAPGGCSATATTTVNVVAPPSLTAWADDYDVCEFSTVYLHATGAKTYEWDGPWGYYSTFQNPVLNYIPSYMTGTYSVTGTGTTGCTTTSSFDVRVYLDINGTATATPNPVPFGETVQLVATGGTSYLWTGPNGFYSTESDPTIFRFNKNNAGIYAVIISNAGGCELTLFVKVDIINPKGSRDNNVNVTSTKIVDGKIYPNPASTSITLQRNADASTVYSIIDMQGRVVVKNATTTDGRVNIEALTPGIYNVMWSQPDVVGNAFNGRFVKVK